MKYIISGPCGIGKSTVAKLLADRSGITHLDLDEIKPTVKKPRGQSSPCSLKDLNLEKCLKDILDNCQKGFVLDIGGGSIFREGKDNQERLNQILWLKTTYNAKVIVLFAEKKEAWQRFFTTKNRQVGGPDNFDNIWDEWEEFEKPYWLQCSDKLIDTTGLILEDIFHMIVESQ